MAKRNIVSIDEEKCTGCGECVTACAEGALQIVNGKAKLVSEIYCDGLGACLGECPEGAITVEQRDVAEFDPEAVARHQHHAAESEKPAPAPPRATQKSELPCGCPSAAAKELRRETPCSASCADEAESESFLGNWPVQLRLVPVSAPYLRGADLVISADCVPFAYADFHRSFLAGRVLVIGCPKLDDAEFYVEKLTEILVQNQVRSVEVLHMEVPCCFGLVQIVRRALQESGENIPLTLTKIGIQGGIVERVGPASQGAGDPVPKKTCSCH